mmetsp:Transcript_22593/g.38525  ORF Transcript_22593/g.38525 Transcript_22593/m.38525 type:complete len:822 (-) Transcript_22593:2122-4587(-)
MYAQNAYFKQRQENLLPTRSPSNSDNDQRQRRRREGPELAEAGMFRNDFSEAMDNSSSDRVIMTNPFTARHELHHRHPPYQNNDERVEHASKRRRVRQLLLLASLAFVGLLVIDGMAQFHYLPEVSVETVYETAEHYERKLIEHRQQQQQHDGEGGLVRRLVGAFLGDEELTKQRPHIVVDDSSQAAMLLNVNNNSLQRQQQQKQRTLLHTLPLLPRHALQHRQRRELIASRKPIPRHLRVNVEDEMYNAPHHQRRRIYPVMTPDMKVVDARNRHLVDDDEGSVYETGALYQGYGTHYIDLWVGTPPQRQTVIVDTGSSITAFPCSGCDHCGDNPATGELYHLDEDFDKFKSSTYEQVECSVGQHDVPNVECPLGVCQHPGADNDQVCQLAVAYAEGSSWTAVEGSDVCYPGGPHETPLANNEQRMAEGVGLGMGEIDAGKEFDWLNFRLKFGCQTKVTGLFRTQLEDGIMGMDNRAGSFWMQLREHYKSKGHGSSEAEEQDFDPNQFALCYDRQPISSELSLGVGSGALTLGGSDSLLHSTPMVYAENLSPGIGWYTVHVKGMFLRSKGGSLSEPANNSRYIRVDADENTLNGNAGANHGIIVDSGTTDSYLPSNLKPAFVEAWKEVLRDPTAEYHNNHIEMSAEQVKTLPTILVVLQGHKSGSAETNDVAVGMTGHPSHAAMFNSITDKNPLTISKNDVVVAIPPEHYMEESHRSPGTWIARIYFTEKYGQQSIFGSSFMMGHEILFDNSSGRVGFSESHCDYSRYMEERDLMLEQIRQNGATNHQDNTATVVEEVKEEVVVNSAQLVGQDNLHGSGWA